MRSARSPLGIAGPDRCGHARRVCRPLATAGAILSLLLTVGATPAGAEDRAAASAAPEFTLAPDRGLVGSFAGCGGQLNQHVYARISGPPPRLGALETKVLALEPQLVRIFFNQTEWTFPDRMDSFVRTVALAHRADAEINVTWRGSRSTSSCGTWTASPTCSPASCTGTADRLWVTMYNEPNTTQRTLGEYEQVYRLLDREPASEACVIASGSWAAI